MNNKVDPSVSVIVPSYNAAAFLPAALQSIFAQTLLPHEIIVVDDGSTDNTADAVDRDRLPGIRYIRQNNQGPSSARNRGIREATGTYLAFLDADDLWLPGKLARQIEVFSRHPSAAMVYGRYENLSEKTGAVSPPFPHTIRSGKLFSALLSESFILLSTVLIRKSVLSEVGGFDEELHTAEDTNLYLRIARGHEIFGMQEVVVRRRLHRENLSDRIDISIGTLKNLDKISAMFPDAAPHRLPEMRRAYMIRGGQMVDQLFYAGAYAKARKTCLRLLRNRCVGRNLVPYLLFLLLPGPVIDWCRGRKRAMVTNHVSGKSRK